MQISEIEGTPAFSESSLFTFRPVPVETLERDQGITAPQGLAALKDPEWRDDEAHRRFLAFVLDDD